MKQYSKQARGSPLAEVSHDEAKMRERRESLSFLSFLPRRERPLLAGKHVVARFVFLSFTSNEFAEYQLPHSKQSFRKSSFRINATA